jgi:hypothetical protein
MKSTKLQHHIVQNMQGLPEETLREILDFVQFLQIKRGKCIRLTK